MESKARLISATAGDICGKILTHCTDFPDSLTPTKNLSCAHASGGDRGFWAVRPFIVSGTFFVYAEITPARGALGLGHPKVWAVFAWLGKSRPERLSPARGFFHESGLPWRLKNPSTAIFWITAIVISILAIGIAFHCPAASYRLAFIVVQPPVSACRGARLTRNAPDDQKCLLASLQRFCADVDDTFARGE